MYATTIPITAIKNHMIFFPLFVALAVAASISVSLFRACTSLPLYPLSFYLFLYKNVFYSIFFRVEFSTHSHFYGAPAALENWSSKFYWLSSFDRLFLDYISNYPTIIGIYYLQMAFSFRSFTFDFMPRASTLFSNVKQQIEFSVDILRTLVEWLS